MEKLILGESLSYKSTETSRKIHGQSDFCDFSAFVMRGHKECGDSAFIYYDKEKAIFGVLDGVSGEVGAASASACAAKELVTRLKCRDHIDADEVKIIFSEVNTKVSSLGSGMTTATILFIEKNGSFVIAGVGDSPIYSINKKGETDLELPMDRPVGNGDSVLKFFHFRNMVNSVLGDLHGELSMGIRKGKLKKGEYIILATDGLADNLFMDVEDGYLSDCSGTRDLKNILFPKNLKAPGKSEHDPDSIMETLIGEISSRFSEKSGRKETASSILVPKKDDLTIIVVRKL